MYKRHAHAMAQEEELFDDSYEIWIGPKRTTKYIAKTIEKPLVLRFLGQVLCPNKSHGGKWLVGEFSLAITFVRK